ncbi:MAG TPA: hypothetical protein VH724_03725 [Candidatus Angelobacter sp.]|nr:hypothetical protein [Candidatus Angelobacter sp.]
MPIPDKTFESADRNTSTSQPLPLFRPEALAALQQKFHGEIILIRPFSLMLLGWFGIGITSAVLGFFLLGQYTEKARVPGIVTVNQSASNSFSTKVEAEFYVPASLIGKLHPGSQLALRCENCSAPHAQQVGTVLDVPTAPLEPAELSSMDLAPAGPAETALVYRIKVSLPPQAARISQLNPSPQMGTRMEADIPLGRKPLIKWFFDRSGG